MWEQLTSAETLEQLRPVLQAMLGEAPLAVGLWVLVQRRIAKSDEKWSRRLGSLEGKVDALFTGGKANANGDARGDDGRGDDTARVRR